ncbi:hypothetical protein KY290_025949 [Solanum tuberosum]|uniref:Uncharacterized protein n=1 Tax=Solanum tuberosum TaxID=4113 RepID=A0ABQ7UWP9_SOLTU|nr:hypothetical protein KY284_036537 [Solanum tuberosum]KAH0673694.1 hypothetical protein KY284_024781 [Solanum tuberosum]KAH0737917.1 hypothetical protein KY290_036622 [Solanum tuberosum]KAH0755679.1 hypothetical protein KY290_025949 [Solanum tuberosum]
MQAGQLKLLSHTKRNNGKYKLEKKTKTTNKTRDQGKNQHFQVQTQQAKTPHMQQTIQKTGMNSKTPVIEIEESGDQIPIPPSLVIVDVKDLCENEVPSPVTTLVVTAEIFGGRME